MDVNHITRDQHALSENRPVFDVMIRTTGVETVPVRGIGDRVVFSTTAGMPFRYVEERFPCARDILSLKPWDPNGHRYVRDHGETSLLDGASWFLIPAALYGQVRTRYNKHFWTFNAIVPYD